MKVSARTFHRLACGALLLLLLLHYSAVAYGAVFNHNNNNNNNRNKKGGSSNKKNSSPKETEEVDYYRILELQDRREAATEKEVRSQFRKLSKAYHPDLNHNTDTKEQYGRINRAYEVLSDKKRRKMYDLRGEEGLLQLERYLSAGPPPQQAFQHPFGHLFGGGGGGAAGLRGGDLQAEVQVDLAQLYAGGEHPISLSKRKVCPLCKGRGHPHDAPMHTCRSCGGQGQVRQRVQIFPGMVQEMVQGCPACGGSGKAPSLFCPRCHGEKFVTAQVTLPLELEQGTEEGQRIVFEMEGEESLDKIPGDLVVRVRAIPHPKFQPRHPHLQQQHQRRRDEERASGADAAAAAAARNPHSVADSNAYLDLDTSLEISLREALVGFERTIPHLDGTPVTVEVAEGELTPFGAELRLAGKGFPKLHVPSERGDLYVKVDVKLPAVLTPAQQAWVRENL